MTDGIFEDPTEVKPVHTIDPNKDYVTELVGEGKKYADVSLLAKSRLEADNHIARIEAENKGIRAELEKRLTMEELLTKINSQTKAPVDGEGNTSTNVEGKPETAATAGVTPEELAKLVDARIAAKVNESVAQTNLTFAKTKLKESFGDDYTKVLDEKVKELGVSREYLNRLAQEQPNVLLKLVDAKPQAAPSNTGSPSRSIDASKMSMGSQTNNDGFRGQKFYTDLLKKDPAAFWSSRTQLEMHNMAMKDPQRYATS